MKQEKNGKRTCPVCGKALPNTVRCNKVFCSRACYHRSHYLQRADVCTTSCIYRPDGSVMCNPNVYNCSTCGWNPEVEERRRKETQGEGI